MRLASSHPTLDSIRVPAVRRPHIGYAASKRACDILISLALLVLLTPVLLAITAAVKLTSRGPVFFRQPRCGRDGVIFHMTKFRSMVADADERLLDLRERARRGEISIVDAPAFKSYEDPRVTRVGKHLRRWSLDELPQLLDVLRGDMSLVGPRPLVPEEARILPSEALVRHAVKPGITCIWQTSGRSRVPYEERLAMDIEYVERRSLGLDLALLLKTPAAVLSGDGAC